MRQSQGGEHKGQRQGGVGRIKAAGVRSSGTHKHAFTSSHTCCLDSGITTLLLFLAVMHQEHAH
jgi:hypothetical protein